MKDKMNINSNEKYSSNVFSPDVVFLAMQNNQGDKFENFELADCKGNANILNDNHSSVNSSFGTSDRANASTAGLLYGVEDVPPWYLAILLAMQQCFTMAASAMTTPYIIAPALCIPAHHPARAYIMSSIMFVSGIATLLQTTFGVRLPIVQGSSASFYIPVFVLLALPQWQCPNMSAAVAGFDNSTISSEDGWRSRMCEVQGNIAVASLLHIILSLTGIVHIVIRYITPLVIAPTVTLIGLSLFDTASNMASKNWAISLSTMIMMIMFSQYMTNVCIPYPKLTSDKKWSLGWFPWFRSFAIITTIATMWLICHLLTIYEVFQPDDQARTDIESGMITVAPWFRIPSPCQWGIPTVSVAGVLGMTAAVVATLIESFGDYYACATISEAPKPPPHAITRGIFFEGVGCILAGLWGTGTGSTSYADNIGAISITKVASRRVFQLSTVFMLLFGVVTKLGAVFVSIPEPVIGGVVTILFGVITAVGISNIQFINLNCSRNLLILGFSIFFGLSLPRWMAQHKDSIKTGNEIADQVLTVLLSTSMLIGGLTGFILDNTIPGKRHGEGLNGSAASDELFDNPSQSLELYDFPFGMTWIKKCHIFQHVPFCPTYTPMNNCCRCRKRKSKFEVSDQTDHI